MRRLESEDNVAYISQNGGRLKLAIVDRTREEYLEDGDEQCKDNHVEDGHVKLQGYPLGEHVNIKQDRVHLIDRALLVGEMVHAHTDDKTVGYVTNVRLNIDLVTLPNVKYVVMNVDSSMVKPVSRSELLAGNTGSLVLYGDWLGYIEQASVRLRCRVNANVNASFWLLIDSNTEIDNVDARERQTYDRDQFYVGQSVNIARSCMGPAQWQTDASDVYNKDATFSKRPASYERFTRRHTGSFLPCTVERVELDRVHMRWATCMGGEWKQPPDWLDAKQFDECTVLDHTMQAKYQVGDRFTYTVADGDEYCTYDEWQAGLKGAIYDEEEEIPHTFASTRTVGEDVGEEGAMSSRASRRSASSCSSTHRIGMSRSLRSYRKRQHTRTQHSTRPSSTSASRLSAGSITGEVVRTHTTVDVMWMTGVHEKGVAATKLHFADNDLDEHVFVTGDIVTCDTCPPTGYGIITTVIPRERMANVVWCDATGKTVDGIDDRQPVINLRIHAQHSWITPGRLCCIEPSTTSGDVNRTALIGEVENVDLETHTVTVHTFDEGRRTGLLPTQLIRPVVDEDDADGWEETETSTNDIVTSLQVDGQVGEHEELSDSGWTTVSEYSDDEGGVEEKKSRMTCDDVITPVVEEMPFVDGATLGGTFKVVDVTPNTHAFITNAVTPSVGQLRVLSREIALLKSSLPHGIHVRAYEQRSDLLSCLMEGPIGTPYEGGLFAFDLALPADYPARPPLVHYLSFAREKLNPNLYVNGKVCTSLLGTWDGQGSETWRPSSTLLQVLVSIQGLVLTAEPYYNEAGYESRRGLPQWAERSRAYNENALVLSLNNTFGMLESTPEIWKEFANEYCATALSSQVTRMRAYMTGEVAAFPLQPISEGSRVESERLLVKLEQRISKIA